MHPSALAEKILPAVYRPDGRLLHPYAKFTGAHWALLILAETGYRPEGDELIPLREAQLDWLLSPGHSRKIVREDRVRTCASMEGAALFSMCRLGTADRRAEQLAEGLIRWQWPDGGWNCDKKPHASHSSFHETLLPMRGLNEYARLSGDPRAARAVERAAEVFLKRRLLYRLSTGELITPSFTRLAYPSYWHYDLRSGLKGLGEAGFLSDPRCRPALDLLEGRRLAGGGWPAEFRYYTLNQKAATGRSSVDWGPGGKTRPNPWVSRDAEWILERAKG